MGEPDSSGASEPGQHGPAYGARGCQTQPWLMDMCRAVEDHGSQALFISHHPELINYLAPQDAVILSRDEGGPTRIKPFTAANQSTLTPAEVIARGWESE